MFNHLTVHKHAQYMQKKLVYPLEHHSHKVVYEKNHNNCFNNSSQFEFFHMQEKIDATQHEFSFIAPLGYNDNPTSNVKCSHFKWTKMHDKIFMSMLVTHKFVILKSIETILHNEIKIFPSVQHINHHLRYLKLLKNCMTTSMAKAFVRSHKKKQFGSL
jgi:hypothetical protein